MADDEEPGLGPEADGAEKSPHVRSAGIAVVAVALITTATACTSTRHPADHRTPDARRPTQGSSCALRVIETGVTRKDHYSAGTRDPDGDLFLASAIVENPCPRAAANAKFVVSPLDGQGHELLAAGRPVQEHFTIALIMPGQRAAGWTYFTRKEAPSGISSLKVQTETRPADMTCWTDPVNSGFSTVARATHVTITERNTSRSLINGEADVSFTVTWSPAKSPLGRRGASVIFRDASGRLLNANGQVINATAKRGHRVQFTAWVPPHSAPARTEVILEPVPDTHGLPTSPSSSCSTGP